MQSKRAWVFPRCSKICYSAFLVEKNPIMLLTFRNEHSFPRAKQKVEGYNPFAIEGGSFLNIGVRGVTRMLMCKDACHLYV
jgi:hypothetical protein